MSLNAFVDKDHQPTMKEVLETVGTKRTLWEDLIQFIADNYMVQGEFAFYGKKYGWTMRFRKGSKPLLSLYPNTDYFTAQIVLGQQEANKAFTLDLSENVRKTLESARQFHDGRWLFVKVKSEQDLEAVKKLLMVKSKPAKKK